MEHSMFMHEIKNSLNVIYGVAQLLPVSTPGEVQQYSDLIIQSIKNIKTIESDFDIYRKTGRIEIKYDLVNINNLINEILDEYKQMIQKYNVNVIFKQKPVKVFTDEGKLRQTLSNLLSNAIKYGSINKENNVQNIIKIFCYSNDNTIIKIKDYGIGMSPSELKQVGIPFYRCKHADRPGTGLGICTIKKFANLLNWKFTLESVKNKGTTATLII